MAKGSTKGSFNDLHKELMKDVDNFKNDIRKQVADDIAKGLSDLNIDVSTGEVKVNVEVDDAKISVDAKKQVEKAVSQTVHPEIEVEPTIKFKKIKGIDISEFINYDKNKLKAQIEELLDKSIDDDSLSSKLNKKLYSAIKVGEAKGFLNLKSKDNIDLKMFIDEFQQANKLTQKEINEINNQINNINLTPVKNTISDINTEVSKVDFNPIKENAEKVIDPITNKIKNLNDALGEYNNIISKMKRPAFHVGNIDDDHLADHLWDKKSLERIGSGLFFQHDLEQALADFDILKSQNKNPKLYITDLGNLSGKMKDLRSEDQYEEYIRYLGLINNFILKTANIADTAPNEKVLSKANIKSLDDLYTEGKQYFDHYNVTRDRLSAIINEAVQYVKSSPKDAKNLDDLSSFFQQKAFNLKGVSTHSLPYLDNSSVGSVVFHPNELKELFSINSPYEIAQSIVKQIIERSIKDKAANPNNTREDLDNLFYNYTNSDAIRNLISTDELKKIFDQSYLINGFSQLTEAAKESGQSITTFIENIKNGTIKAEDEITELANSLKNISNLENGTRHTDGFISDTYTLIGRDMEYLQKTEALIPLLEEAENRGVRVGTIIGTIADAENNLYYEIQKTQSGEIIDSSNLGFLEATDDEIQELIKHLNILQELGLFVDTGGQNLLYEKGKGFSFIDLAVPKDINKVPDYLKNTASGIMESLEEYLPFDKNFKILDEYADKFEKFKTKITTSLSLDKTPDLLDSSSAIQQYIDSLEKVDTKSKEIREAIKLSRKNDNAGSSLDTLQNLQNEIELTREVREEQEKINQAKKEQDLSFEDGITEKQVNILDEYIDRLATSQSRIEENLRKSNKEREKQTALDSELQNFAKLGQMVDEVRQAIEKKTEAFVEEGRTVDKVVESELQALKALLDMLQDVSKNVKELQESFDKLDLSKTADLSWIKELKKLKPQDLNQAAEALTSMFEAVKGLELGDNNFLNSISGLLSQGDKLKNLATIISASKKQLSNADKAINGDKSSKGNNDVVKNETRRVNALYKEQISNLKEIQKLRLANLNLDDSDPIQAKQLEQNLENIARLEERNLSIEKELDNALLNRIDKHKEILALQEKQAIELKQAQELKQVKDQAAVEEAAAKAEANAYKEVITALNELYKLKEKNAKNPTDTLSDQIAEQEIQLQEKVALLSEENAVKFVEAENEKKAALEQTIKLLDEQKSKIDNTKYDNTVESIQKELDGISSKKLNEKGLDWINQFQSKLNSLKTDRSEEELKALEAQIKETFDGDKLKNFQLASANTVAQVRRQAEEFLAKATSLSPERKAQVQEIIMRLDAGPAVREANDLKAALANVKAEAAKAGETGKRFIDIVKERLIGVNAQLIAQYLSWQDLIRYFRTAADQVLKIDTAITELRKVSDASTTRLSESFETSTETAKQLGSSIDEVISKTSDWARLGYNVDQAEELARVTTLFQTVGDNMTSEDASSYLISTMQGFQLATDQAEEIVNRYNEVANNFAIDTRGIGEALQRSAASFAAANTDLSGAIALITATKQHWLCA